MNFDHIEFPGANLKGHAAPKTSLYRTGHARQQNKRERPIPKENPDHVPIHDSPPPRSQDKCREQARPQPLMKITQAAFQAILDDLGQRPFRHEQAGILLGPTDTQDLVTHYVQDRSGQATAGSFTIDSDGLNAVIKRVRNSGLTCIGMVHSHPDGICRPSHGDLVFLEAIFSNPKNGSDTSYFLFPIVCSGKLYPFVVDVGDVRRVLVAQLVLV